MTRHSQRMQQTIARPVQVSGFGLFGGIDVTIEFCPAEVNHGIIFERIDLSEPVKIAATIDNVIPRPRCTVISEQDVTVSVVEHVMAALAGLQIDNCLVKINAPEPPGCDGSSAAFVDALLKAEVVVQDQPRECVVVDQTQVTVEDDCVGIGAQAPRSNEFEIGFILDYGNSAIPQQSLTVQVTPETFIDHIASARTFVLEEEVAVLQAHGIGCRATTDNILVFGQQGPISNSLRFHNECVRHKILDCIGDFALMGADLAGRFTAMQSGHRLNHSIIRQLKQSEAAEHSCSAKNEQLNTRSQCRAAG